MGRTFYMVDVFAQKKYTGNQLAVFPEADGLSSDEMQAIAREINFSETTFILAGESGEGKYKVRIFTPAAEVPFAGHPTLGTAAVIGKYLVKSPLKQIVLQLQAGLVPVTFEPGGHAGDILWLEPPQPELGPELDPALAAGLVSLQPDQVERRFPVQVVSTGIPFIFIPVTSLQAVQQARENTALYETLPVHIDSRLSFVFCPQALSPEHDMHARMFASSFGIAEDPATGSACACLAAYLVKYRVFGRQQIDVRVEQGYEINRPSSLFLRAVDQDGHYDIRVGGKVYFIARGELI